MDAKDEMKQFLRKRQLDLLEEIAELQERVDSNNKEIKQIQKYIELVIDQEK